MVPSDPRSTTGHVPDGPARMPDGHGRDVPDDDDEYVGQRDLTRWDTSAGRALVAGTHRVVDRAEKLWGWAAPRWLLLVGVITGVLLAASMALGTSEVYEAVVEGDGVAGLDQPLLDSAVQARTPTTEALVTAYTDIGGQLGMSVLATLVAIGLGLRWRSWTPPALMAIVAAGSLSMTVAGKAAVGRARPPLEQAVPPFESSFSFPSGHTLNSTALAGIVAYLLVRKMRRRWSRALTVVLAAVFAVTIGLSRVYLGHHWLTDVVVAWLLALGWLAIVITGHRLWLTDRRRGTHRVPAPGG